MLGKMIKYDILSTWRSFAGIFLSILMGVILVPTAIKNFNSALIQMSAGILAIGIVVAVLVVTMVNLFKMYNSNVLSKEGYLTMTLPVKTGQLLASKLLVSSMWIILTGVVSVIGLLIFSFILVPSSLTELRHGITELLSYLDGTAVRAIILLLVLMVLSTTKEIAKLYLACTIAQSKSIPKWRTPIGILAYFVLGWIESLAIQIVLLPLFQLPYFTQGLYGIDQTGITPNMIGVFEIFIWISLAFTLIFIAAFIAPTYWMLEKKLDLG